MRPHSLAPGVVFLAAVWLAPVAVAQCAPQWAPGFGCPGVNSVVAALAHWDPDGTGPAPAVVAIGGGFQLAGTTPAPGVATWSPSTGSFAPLPAPPASPNAALEVYALAAMPNGALAVGYYDWSVPAGHVALWNGTQWTGLGAAFDERPVDLHVRPNGELLVAGLFNNCGGVPLAGLARWNGASWQAVGGGLDGPVFGTTDDVNGDLLVCGAFTTAGGVATNGVARWNGGAWSAVGGTVPTPNALAVSAGRMFAATFQGFYELVAGTWSQVPGLSATPFPQAQLQTAVRLANGNILVGGILSAAGGTATHQVAVFDPVGNTWSTLGAGVGQYMLSARPAVVDLANGNLLVGGAFTVAGGVPVANLARWNGSQWSALADGPAEQPVCAVAIDDTRFVVGGTFTGMGNVPAANVAEWNGSAWGPLGTGLGGPVQDLVRMPNGDLIATGAFATTGSGAVARGIARWNGGTWSELGGGLQYFSGAGGGTELLVRANGDLVVVGTFTGAGGAPFANIAVWNGSTWSGLGGGLPQGAAKVVETDGGDLLVAIASSPGSVYRWNGSSWSIAWSLQLNESIVDIAALPDGGMVIAGTRSLFYGTNSRGVLEYIGASSYLRLETLENRSYLTGLVPLPGGDVLVSGGFGSLAIPSGPVVATANQGCVRLAASGLFVPAPAMGYGQDAAAFPNGDRLVVGGLWGSGVHFVGRLTTPCPATASATGAGCSGSGGANVLTARELPWLGGWCTSVATGMPAQGLALEVRGLGTATTPLASILPQGQPGCSLLVTPDLLTAYVPNGGSVAVSFAIPNVAALVGASLHQQVVALEIAAGGVITALTATNGLSLTIGAF
ncbi:MAG: exo-alpha-sialidase [Planctomycetes bacterium]|nr:exo-alpha-sialidase [Planctomycetota bacterium]